MADRDDVCEDCDCDGGLNIGYDPVADESIYFKCPCVCHESLAALRAEHDDDKWHAEQQEEA